MLRIKAPIPARVLLSILPIAFAISACTGDVSLAPELAGADPVAPVAGEALADATCALTLTWGEVTDAEAYLVYINGVQVTTSPTPSATVTLDRNVITYSWFVEACAAHDCVAGQTASFDLSCGELPPDPVDVVCGTFDEPLTWGAIAGANTYEIELTDLSGGAASELLIVTDGSTFVFPSAPLGQGQYSWRVRAVIAGEPLRWSEAVRFDVVAAPVNPVLTAASACADQAAAVNWTEVAGESYTVQYSPDGATWTDVILRQPVNTAGLAQVTMVNTAPMPPPETHFWRIRTARDSCLSDWSVTAFSVSTSQSVTLNPTPGGGCESDTYTFSWIAEGGLVNYDFELSDATGSFAGGTTMLDVNGLTTVDVSGLTAGTYAWRVMPTDSPCVIPGFVTSADTFQVIAQDNPVVAATPADACQGDALTFGWTTTGVPSDYTIYIDNAGGDFSAPLWTQAVFGSDTATVAAGTPLPPGTYRWRVEPTGSCPGTFDDSTDTFTIFDTAGVTLGADPADGCAPYEPTFNWNNVGPLEDYTVRVRDSGTSAVVWTDTALNATSITIPAASGLVAGTYTWEVEPISACAGPAAVSSGTFLVENTDVITLNPDPAGDCAPYNATVSWNRTDPTASYEVQLDAPGNNFAAPVTITTAMTSHTFNNLAVGDYEWRVRSLATCNEGWITGGTFTSTANSTATPGAVTNLDCVSDTGSLAWTGTSLGTYSVEIDQVGDAFGSPEQTFATEAGPFVSVTGLPVGTYEWRVRSNDTCFDGWHVGTQFTIAAETTAVPTTTPANGACELAGGMLDWTSSNAAGDFRVQVTETSDTTWLTPNVNTIVTGTGYTIPNVLAAGTYMWRVRSEDPCRAAFATGGTFTVDPRRTVSVDTEPPAILCTNEDVVVDFSGDSLVGYQIEVSDDFTWVDPPEASDYLLADTATTVNLGTLPAGTYKYRIQPRDTCAIDWEIQTGTFEVQPVTGLDGTSLNVPSGACQPYNATFTWTLGTAIQPVSGYILEVYTNSTFTGTPHRILNPGPTDLTDTATGLLNGTYYWRIRSADTCFDAWHEQTTPFVVDNPATVTVTAEPGATICESDDIEFTISGTSTAGYVVEISDDFTFATADYTSGTFAAGTTAINLGTAAALSLPNGTYKWRISPQDGCAAATTQAATFTINADATITAGSLSHSTPGTCEPQTATFNFAGTATSGYILEIYNNATFTPPVVQTLTPAAGATSATHSLNDGTYYWRIIASDTCNDDWHNGPGSLVVDPTYFADANSGATNATDGCANLSGTVSWSGDSPTGYDVQISSDGFTSAAVSGTPTGTSFAFANLPPGTYEWRVRPQDACATTWSVHAATFESTANAEVSTVTNPAGGCSTYDAPLSWTGTSAIGRYNVEVGPTSQGAGVWTTITTSTTNFNGTSWTATGLTNGGGASQTYKWRVRPSDTCFVDWVDGGTFDVDRTFEVFGITLPADGCAPYSPSITWLGDGSGYEIQVSTDGTFSTIDFQDNAVVGTSRTFNNMPAGDYHVRVRTSDACDLGWLNAGSTFSVGAVTTVTIPGGATPTSGQCAPLDDTLTWNSTSGTSTYTVEIHDSGTSFSSLVMSTSGHSGTSWNFTNLPAGTYEWRVLSDDGCNNGYVNGPGTFTVTETRTVSSTTNPTDACRPMNATLTWAGTGTSYEVQVSQDPTFATSTTQTGVVGTSHTFNNLAAGDWYWRVRAEDACNDGFADAATPFTSIEPRAPIQNTPLNNANEGSTGIVLDWFAVPNATSYDFEVSTSAAFGAVHESGNTGLLTQETLTATYATGTTYYWRVRAAFPGACTSAWSPVRAFNVGGDIFVITGDTTLGASNNLIMESSDSGATWSAITGNNWGATSNGQKDIVLFDGKLFATADTGLYYSTNGQTWTQVTLSQSTALRAHVSNVSGSPELFVGTFLAIEQIDTTPAAGTPASVGFTSPQAMADFNGELYWGSNFAVPSPAIPYNSRLLSSATPMTTSSHTARASGANAPTMGETTDLIVWDGYLWVANDTMGVIAWDGTAWSTTQFGGATPVLAFELEVFDGSLWVGSDDGLHYATDPFTDTPTHVANADVSRSHTVSTMLVSDGALLIGSGFDVAVGTNTGLIRTTDGTTFTNVIDDDDIGPVGALGGGL